MNNAQEKHEFISAPLHDTNTDTSCAATSGAPDEAGTGNRNDIYVRRVAYPDFVRGSGSIFLGEERKTSEAGF